MHLLWTDDVLHKPQVQVASILLDCCMVVPTCGQLWLMQDINMPPPQQQLHSQPSGSVISSAPPTPLKGGTAGTTGAPAHVAQRDQITACSVGAHKLKGIQGDQLLMEVRWVQLDHPPQVLMPVHSTCDCCCLWCHAMHTN
jgi:hypothetical protein